METPIESKVLYQAKVKEIDFKTIDKLCVVNKDFETFITKVKKVISSSGDSLEELDNVNDFNNFCDDYFKLDSEAEIYCKSKKIPFEEEFI